LTAGCFGWQVAYNVAMFAGCFYLVHFRLLPNIMAGKFHAESSGSGAVEEGVARAVTATSEVSPPQVGMQVMGQACHAVKADGGQGASVAGGEGDVYSTQDQEQAAARQTATPQAWDR
jgi:hypothetical protein